MIDNFGLSVDRSVGRSSGRLVYVRKALRARSDKSLF